MSELGPRVSNNQYDVYQATVGVSGEILDGWQYDAYVQVGANDQTDHQTGNVLTSRIEELTFAPDGGVSICGGFNPFGLDSISRECAGLRRGGCVEPCVRGPGDRRSVVVRPRARDARR